MAYKYLPGTYMSVNDGGLAQKPNFTSKRTVILGTSASGPADVQYQVVDRAVAAQTFGLQGTLIQAMEEVAQGGCDNILLFRIGAEAATLSNIGTELYDTGVQDGQSHDIYAPVDSNNAGYQITFGQITPTIANDYQVYYSGANPTNDTAGILEIYYKGNLVYSNDPNAPVDTQDCTVSGLAIGGKAIINSSVSTSASRFDKSLPLSNSLISASVVTDIPAQISPSVPAHREPALVLSLGDTGLSLTPGSVNYDPCSVYEAQDQAFRLLELSPVDQVYTPNAYFDTPNVAFLIASALSNDVNNPANGKALGWLKTSVQETGDIVYTWAHKVQNSAGVTVVPPTFTSARDRVSRGFHEVSFGYQVARFAATQSQNEGGCVAFIGTSAPRSYKPTDLKSWYGQLPTYGSDGVTPAVSGSGLLGNPYLTGTMSARLNPLCADIATKAYRLPGFFQTVNVDEPARFGEYDGGIVIDDNSYQVDLGKYLVLTCSWALLRNGYQNVYANNIAGVVAGYTSALDEKLALTNKALPGVSQIYRVGASTLDALTQAKINELKFKGDAVPPVLTHDRTVASLGSDYTFLLRLRILFLITNMIFQAGDNFVGRSSTDGLTIAALDTDLDKKFQAFLKGSYISGYAKNVYTTKSDKAAGRFFITATFVPADEAVQLVCKVAAGN